MGKGIGFKVAVQTIPGSNVLDHGSPPGIISGPWQFLSLLVFDKPFYQHVFQFLDS